MKDMATLGEQPQQDEVHKGRAGHPPRWLMSFTTQAYLSFGIRISIAIGRKLKKTGSLFDCR